MTSKKTVSERVQETLSLVAVPPLRISVPAMSMDAPTQKPRQSERAKRRELLVKCRDDLESFVSRDRRDPSVKEPAA